MITLFSDNYVKFSVAFPFCRFFFLFSRSTLFIWCLFVGTENELKKTLHGHNLNICFANKTHGTKYKATCQLDYNDYQYETTQEYDLRVSKFLTYYPYPSRSNDLQPVPLNNQFKTLFRKRPKKVYGSRREYRFCPMISVRNTSYRLFKYKNLFLASIRRNI